ncbi:MAG: sirohydrochlorin chelatase [Proteobacteria bacterium]|nr:sirohydrochlorin chelatase [Pseudomonadota bacterium]
MRSTDTGDCILLVGHGSRNSKGNDEIMAFAKQWQADNTQWQIETCFIEFADVMLDQGLDNAVKRIKGGASRVIVVPLILNAAGHVKMEIPAHIEKARQRHTKTEFIYARHLGATESILKILKRRLRSAMAELDMPDPKTTGVIVLGRGSSDRVANGELAKMTRWLFEEGDHELVDMAFTGITHPRLELAVQRQVKLGMSQVVVLPYYLFTGTLIERIQRQVQHLQTQYPQTRFAAADYFGFEKEIAELMSQHVHEAQQQLSSGQMECDGCQYRELAEEHGHGHQHAHEHSRSHAHDHHHHDTPHAHESEKESVA